MYFNDVHIFYYVISAILGGIVGQVVDYSSKAFIKGKKLLKKETFQEYLKTATPNYILIISTIVSYVVLVYKFEIYITMSKNLELIKYMLLIPMLLCAFYVDLKEQIIPNRLNLTMFEIGLVFVVINGFLNINIALNMIYGMLAGGGIFLAITLVGGFIAGKEAMGLGDVKLMGALRIVFWFK